MKINNSREIRITLALPFVIKLKDSVYKIRLRKNEANLHLSLEQANIGQEIDDKARIFFKASTGEIAEAYKTKVPGGLLQYSLITIHFWRKIKTNEKEELQQLGDYRLAYIFLNHFIDIYRYIAKDLEVRPLTWIQFQTLRAGRALHYWSNEIVKGKGKLIMGVKFPEEFPLILFRSISLLTEDQHNHIISLLSSDKKPEIVDLLLLNSEAYKIEQELRLAMVDAGTSLDIEVEKAAAIAMKAQGFSKIDIEKLERLSTKYIVEENLPTMLKPDISGLKEWQDWDKTGRTLRNKVIHDGYEPTIQEVEFCLETVKSIISAIRTAKLITKI